jgi:hypothetical protein
VLHLLVGERFDAFVVCAADDGAERDAGFAGDVPAAHQLLPAQPLLAEGRQRPSAGEVTHEGGERKKERRRQAGEGAKEAEERSSGEPRRRSEEPAMHKQQEQTAV